MDTDPPVPQDPLDPWSLGSNKKKEIQKIVGFFRKNTEEEVLKEREAADAIAEQARPRLEAAHRATAIQ